MSQDKASKPSKNFLCHIQSSKTHEYRTFKQFPSCWIACLITQQTHALSTYSFLMYGIMYSNPKHMSPVIPRPFITNPENNAGHVPKTTPQGLRRSSRFRVVILFSHSFELKADVHYDRGDRNGQYGLFTSAARYDRASGRAALMQ